MAVRCDCERSASAESGLAVVADRRWRRGVRVEGRRGRAEERPGELCRRRARTRGPRRGGQQRHQRRRQHRQWRRRAALESHAEPQEQLAQIERLKVRAAQRGRRFKQRTLAHIVRFHYSYQCHCDVNVKPVNVLVNECE